MQRKRGIVLGIGVGVAIVVGALAWPVRQVQHQDQNRRRLFYAIQHNDTSTVRTLLEAGLSGDVRRHIAPPNGMDTLRIALHLQPIHTHFGASALAEAVFSGDDPEIIRLLLAHGARANAPQDAVLTSALGPLNGRPVPEIVQLLLEHGADPNLRLPGRRGPLFLALGHDGKEVGPLTKMLLDHGADPLQPDRDGPQPFSYLALAIWADHPKVVAAMLDHGVDIHARDTYAMGGIKPMTPLTTAIAAGYLDTIKMLLARGVPIEPLDGEGLIRDAVRGHDEAFLKALIARGVGIESKTWLGMTPLMSIAYGSSASDDQKHRLAEMETLLAHGANINARNKDGQTPLIVACWSSKDLPQLKFLIAHGADPNARDTRGAGGLYYAAAGGGGEPTVSYLLAHGANARLTYSQGYTALMGAAVNKGDAKVVAPLVAAGSDLNAHDKKGNTALMLARLHHHTALVQALLKAGATH
ncbi:MAG: ankyrin repeat protein [Chthonomonadales bacterium]|nr:ankyrin repeat protein [Chthonomonadales bacterium]